MHAEVLVGNRNTGPNPCYLTYPLSDKGIGAGAGLKHELEGNGYCSPNHQLFIEKTGLSVIKLQHPSRTSIVNFAKMLNDYPINSLIQSSQRMSPT